MTSNVLAVGQTLSVGDSLLSSNGSYGLKMNADGTLMVFRAAELYSIWYSSLPGPQGDYFATLQSDGDLVIREGTPDAPGNIWWLANGEVLYVFTMAWGFPGPNFYAILGDDGNFSVRRGTGPNADGTINDSGLIWQTGPDYTAVTGLGPIQNNASQNGLFSTRTVGDVLQVVGADGEVRWSSPSGGNPQGIALLMKDGNFGVYLDDSTGVRTPIWQTGIACRGSDDTRPFVLLENDGNLSVHDNWGRLWSAQCGMPGGVAPPPPGPVQSVMDQFSAILSQAPDPFPTYSGAEKDAFDTINGELQANYQVQLWGQLASVEQGWMDALKDRHPEWNTDAYATVLADIDDAIGDAQAVETFFTNLLTVSEAASIWLYETVEEVSELAVLGQATVITLGGGEAGTVMGMIAAPLSTIGEAGTAIGIACTIAQGLMTLGGNAAVANNPALAAIAATKVQMQVDITAAQSQLNVELGTYLQDLVGTDSLDCGKLRAAAALFAPANADWGATIANAFKNTARIPSEVGVWQAVLAAGFTIQSMIYDGPTGLPGNAFIDTGDYPSFEPSNVPVVGAWLDQLYPGTLQEPDDPQPRPGCWARFRALASAGDGAWLAGPALQRLFIELAVPVEDVFDGRNGWCLPRTTYYGSYPFNVALQIVESTYWGPTPVPQ